MNPAIVGTWIIESPERQGEHEYIHICSDGRIVHFTFAQPEGHRVWSVKLWATPMGGNHYQIRPKPVHEGWPVEILPSENGLRTAHNEKSHSLLPALDACLPNWFNSRLEKALAEMTELEEQAQKAQQAGDCDAPQQPR